MRRSCLPVLAVALLAVPAPPGVEARGFTAAGVQAADATSWATLTALEGELRADPGSLYKGARYRQLIIQSGQYDRAIRTLRALADAHPQSIEAHVNLALAYVDKVPVSGKIRQALLGRDALAHLSRAIAIRPMPLTYFCRGLVNLFYDALIFNRVRLGVADLEEALRLQRQLPPRPYHARVYVSLGDGYWKLKNLDKAKAIWSEGLARFPDNAELEGRVAKQGRDLEWTVRIALDPDHRVDTSLREILDDLPSLGLR